ncbi:MAG TPA: LysE family translocator [Alphaproteobacteria bacterium]|nr:LysE family translocator [Alphaproteobacteria bacterium]
MPDFHTWIAFAAAAEALLIIPGPTVLLVVSYALAQGRRSAWATVPGVAAGDFTAMALSLLGLGAVLAASAELFTVLKICGAAYLVYLGIKVLRTPVPERLDEGSQQERSRWRITAHAYTVTALNPKGIVFYVAFFPLFLSADRPLLPQIVTFGATFLVMATINAALYAVLAGQVTRFLRGYRARKNLNRAAGGILLLTGGLLGLAQRS